MNSRVQTGSRWVRRIGWLWVWVTLVAVLIPRAVLALTPGQAEDGFVERGTWAYYSIPTSNQQIRIEVYNLTDDVDMYVGINFQPTKTLYNCRPYNGGLNPETCVFTNFGTNTYNIGVFGYNTSSFTIEASTGGGASCDLENGDWGYCTNPDCAPCDAGEGDCDSDGECREGLVCVQDVGDKYGFISSLDMCEASDGGVSGDTCVLNNGDWSYCSDPNCAPCNGGEGDCDSDDECRDNLVCVQDIGSRYGFSIIMDMCEDLSGSSGEVPGSCPLTPGNWEFCANPDCGPCQAGQGDCDSDAECQDGLECRDNVGADYGYTASLDVCEVSQNAGLCTRMNGDWGYCSDPLCAPCDAGEGDCDDKSECAAGLICADDAGAKYGWPSSLDVCESPSGGGAGGLCNLSVGTWGYCADPECGPCAEGEGDCDGDDECRADLVCIQGAGASYGFPSSMDICETPTAGSSCGKRPGDWSFCADPGCGRCDAGEGDCDSDAECADGLVCVQGAGAKYGFPSSMDVCEVPTSSSDGVICTKRLGEWGYCAQPGCGPCAAGEADCDSDADCQAGLVCSQDVGGRYGWLPNIDVCEAPTQ